MTTTLAMPALWQPLIERWRARSGGPDFSTIYAGFPAASDASAAVGGGTLMTARRTRSRFRPSSLDRYPYGRPQTPHGTIRQHDISAVRSGDVARNGKA